MELSGYTQRGYSSASPPRWESRNQVYENICETLSNVEMIDASVAPHAPRMGRRTRYALTLCLDDHPCATFFATLLFSARPLTTYQTRTSMLSETSYIRIASSLLTLRPPNILVFTLDARSLAPMPMI